MEKFLARKLLICIRVSRTWAFDNLGDANMKKFLLSLKIVAAFIAPQANATPVAWSPSTGTFSVDGGFGSYGDFDDGYLTFNTSFVASSIDSITSQYGMFHGHGGINSFNIDVKLNGVWTNVYTSAQVNNSSPDDIQFNGLITPGNEILFSSGVVSGLRLYSTNYVGNAFHGLYDYGTNYGAGYEDTVFNFGTLGGAGVPAPGALALLGLGLLGLGGLRRKRAA